MENEFEMTDLGLMKFFLGIEVHRYESGIFILQSKYASVVLKRLNMSTLVENERLVTKKMTKTHISMTTFGLAIAGG